MTRDTASPAVLFAGFSSFLGTPVNIAVRFAAKRAELGRQHFAQTKLVSSA